ncbi:hypothetical protein, partial [Actinomyces oris]
PPSTFTLLDADPLAEADDPESVIVVADDVSGVPASSAELEASSTEAFAPRMSETLAPVDAVATDEEIVVHVVSDSLEFEALALPEAEEVEQPAARAIAARNATAPVARRRSRWRGVVVVLVVFMVSGPLLLGFFSGPVSDRGWSRGGVQAALAVARVASMLSRLERSVPNRSASS